MTALFFHSNDLAHLFEACYTRGVLSKFSDITGGKEVLMPFKKTKHLVFFPLPKPALFASSFTSSVSFCSSVFRGGHYRYR